MAEPVDDRRSAAGRNRKWLGVLALIVAVLLFGTLYDEGKDFGRELYRFFAGTG